MPVIIYFTNNNYNTKNYWTNENAASASAEIQEKDDHEIHVSYTMIKIIWSCNRNTKLEIIMIVVSNEPMRDNKYASTITAAG